MYPLCKKRHWQFRARLFVNLAIGSRLIRVRLVRTCMQWCYVITARSMMLGLPPLLIPNPIMSLKYIPNQPLEVFLPKLMTTKVLFASTYLIEQSLVLAPIIFILKPYYHINIHFIYMFVLLDTAVETWVLGICLSLTLILNRIPVLVNIRASEAAIFHIEYPFTAINVRVSVQISLSLKKLMAE